MHILAWVLVVGFFVAWRRAVAYIEWARGDTTERLIALSWTDDGREALRAMGFVLTPEDDEDYDIELDESLYEPNSPGD